MVSYVTQCTNCENEVVFETTADVIVGIDEMSPHHLLRHAINLVKRAKRIVGSDSLHCHLSNIERDLWFTAHSLPANTPVKEST